MIKLFTLIIFIACFIYAGDPTMPNYALTPGAVDSNATIAKLRVTGQSKTVRKLPKSREDSVFARYGVVPETNYWTHYEIDRLIPAELGGSDNIKNLWPQSYTSWPWNAKIKDRLELELHRLVITGKVPLKQAQQEIANDWIAAYQKYCVTK